MSQRIQLLGGTYEARSIIANAQRCVNLYPERNPPPQPDESPAPMTHYPTPGLVRAFSPVTPAPGRGLYTATNGNLYYVTGTAVYFVSPTLVFTIVGNLIDDLTTPVSMVDNSNVLVIVDGTAHGYAIDLVGSGGFAKIIDPNFLGADRVQCVDTYFVLNQPASRNFYLSNSDVTFDSLCVNPGTPTAGTISTPGSGYTDGSYPATPLTDVTGSGTGATADITVSGNAVTVVTLNGNGLGYAAGDVLSAVLPAGSSFEYTLTAVDPVAFNPLAFGQKTGFPDQISTILVNHREIWVFGIVKTTEVWYDAGAFPMPYQILPGVFIEHGCVAKYSPATHDLITFWLSIDADGQGTVFKGEGYRAVKISTPAIAATFARYSVISDAIGMMYKQADHVFYVLTFPTADATWVYDLTEGLWHERTWTDPSTGLEHRHRANCMALAYGMVFAGDWQNGTLYQLGFDTQDDFGGPIVRRRGFPHLIVTGNRVTYDRFVADMECGNGLAVASVIPGNPPVPAGPVWVTDVPSIHWTNDDPQWIGVGNPAVPATPDITLPPPLITLRISDTRGRTFRSAPTQPLGATGEYYAQPQWRQLGMARDRVFELSWSDPVVTALNGAFIDVTPTVEPGT